jgi:uncharacterized protein
VIVNGEKQGILKINEDGKPSLIGSNCKSCGKVSFPKKEVCPYCLTKSNYETIEFGQKGTISTFTICHTAPRGFEAPYALGLVNTDNNIQVLSQIEGDLSSMKQGEEVDLILSPTTVDEAGNQHFAWKYKVTQEGGV